MTLPHGPRKIRVATVSLAGCFGCHMSFLDIDERLLALVDAHFRSVEKTDALEPFYPDRLASRILGMGDVLGLVEEVQRKADHAAAAQLAEKISTGKQFHLNDLRAQLEQISGMGGVESMLDKLPLPAGMSNSKLPVAPTPPHAKSASVCCLHQARPIAYLRSNYSRRPRISQSCRRRRRTPCRRPP